MKKKILLIFNLILLFFLTLFISKSSAITVEVEQVETTDKGIVISVNADEEIQNLVIYKKDSTGNYIKFYECTEKDYTSRNFFISKYRLSTKDVSDLKVVVWGKDGQSSSELNVNPIPETPEPSPSQSTSPSPSPSETATTSPSPSTSDTTSPSPSASTIPEVTSIKLDKSSLTLNTSNKKTATLKPTITPSDSSKKLTWSTSNKKVATINTSGKVTAVSAGTCTITVKTANGKKATCKVIVEDEPEVTKVLLIGNSYTYINDYGGMLAEMAKKTGHKIIVVEAVHGGYGAQQLATSHKLWYFYWKAYPGKTTYKEGSQKNKKYSVKEIAQKDWGNLNRSGEWDYVILQNNSGTSNLVKGDKKIYKIVANMIPNSKRFIINSTHYAGGGASSINKRRAKHKIAAKELNCSIEDTFTIWNQYSNWRSNLIVNDSVKHQSGKGAYLMATVTYARIFGKDDLAQSKTSSKFIQLYSDSGTYKNFVKSLCYYKSNSSVSRQKIKKNDAKYIQYLVYKNYKNAVMYY